MLRSFVSEDDYPLLIDILQRIHNNTLRDDVSVLCISGAGSSGKSTLQDVMRSLGSSRRININGIFPRGSGPETHMLAFTEPTVYASEYEHNPTMSLGNIMFKCHRLINEGVAARQLHSAQVTGINRPGVLVIATNVDRQIPVGRPETWCRERFPEHMMYMHPFAFTEIDDPEGKRPRYPMHLHLPNRFHYDPNVDVVGTCIAEFFHLHQLMRSISADSQNTED